MRNAWITSARDPDIAHDYIILHNATILQAHTKGPVQAPTQSPWTIFICIYTCNFAVKCNFTCMYLMIPFDSKFFSKPIYKLCFSLHMKFCSVNSWGHRTWFMGGKYKTLLLHLGKESGHPINQSVLNIQIMHKGVVIPINISAISVGVPS